MILLKTLVTLKYLPLFLQMSRHKKYDLRLVAKVVFYDKF